ICSPMTSLKTSIKTITYLSDIGCLEIQGASLQKTDLQGSAAYVGAVNKDTVKNTIRLLHIFFMVTSEHLFLTDKFQHSHYSTIFLVADIQ
ncbi:hypothetical protein SAMN05216485_10471, partial [Shigella sonnei]